MREVEAPYVNSYDADDRHVFETESVPLYEEMLTEQGISASDPRIVEGGKWAAGLVLLERLGLASLDQGTNLWMAADPSLAQAQVVAPMSQTGAQLLTESAQWARAFATVGQAWRHAPQPTTSGPFTYLQRPHIDPYIAALVSECEEEVLTAHPEAGRQRGAGHASAIRRDIDLVKRGCRLRTLYQHSARRNPLTQNYVAEVTSHGDAQVRTLDEFFNRMIIIDRRAAVIPNKNDLSVAVVVREPAVVAFLVDVFERTWERGRPFTNRGMPLVRDIALEQRAMTVRMLIEGHSDKTSANRLGVSSRTYASYISDLKEEYDVSTRFQLGYLLGQRGVSGTETHEHAEP